MLTALRRLFVWLLFGPQQGIPGAAPSIFEARLSALEGEQLRMLDEWHRTREQILRWMKRQAHFKPEPLPELSDGGDEDETEADEIDRLIMRRKLGGGS
jgi:hypothetical protein